MYTHTGGGGHLWWDTAGNPLKANADNAYWGIAYINYVRERLFGCPAFRNLRDAGHGDAFYGGDQKLDTSAFAANGCDQGEHDSDSHAEVILRTTTWNRESRTAAWRAVSRLGGVNLTHTSVGEAVVSRHLPAQYPTVGRLRDGWNPQYPGLTAMSPA